MVHEPPDALLAPRFTGPRTYARLPFVKALDDVDCAVFGMPWDGGASFRPGARFGPEAIRSASGMIRTYNAEQGVQVFGVLSTIDYGDAPTVPGYIEDTLERIDEFVTPLVEAGVVTFGMGGDHSSTLAELRAVARVHGPLGLVHFDSHSDLGTATSVARTRTGRCFGAPSRRVWSIRRGSSKLECTDRCMTSRTRTSPMSSAST